MQIMAVVWLKHKIFWAIHSSKHTPVLGRVHCALVDFRGVSAGKLAWMVVLASACECMWTLGNNCRKSALKNVEHLHKPQIFICQRCALSLQYASLHNLFSRFVYYVVFAKQISWLSIFKTRTQQMHTHKKGRQESGAGNNCSFLPHSPTSYTDFYIVAHAQHHVTRAEKTKTSPCLFFCVRARLSHFILLCICSFPSLHVA